MRPPKKEDHNPRQSARPGLPDLTKGKPSNVVATEDGVPGIPVNIQDINPPENPPTNTPNIVARPCIGDIPKVKERVKTTPIAIVKPGIAPAKIPASVPINIKPRVTGSKTMLAKACKITSTIDLPNPK